jgi:hypothetical protein
MAEDFGFNGDEFLIGDCQEDHLQENDVPMDGDEGSALASAGLGTDEDYGYFGGNDDF